MSVIALPLGCTRTEGEYHPVASLPLTQAPVRVIRRALEAGLGTCVENPVADELLRGLTKGELRLPSTVRPFTTGGPATRKRSPLRTRPSQACEVQGVPRRLGRCLACARSRG